MSFTRIAVSTVTIAALTFPALLAPTTSLAVTPAPIAVDDLVYLDATYGAGPGGGTVLVGEVSVAALLLANDLNADEASNPIRFVMWSNPRRGDWGADDACRQSCDPYLQFPLVYYAKPGDPDHRTDTFSYAIVDGDGDFSVATAVMVFDHQPQLAVDGFPASDLQSNGGPVSVLPYANDVVLDRPLSLEVYTGGPYGSDGIDGTAECAEDSNPVVTLTPDGSLFGGLGVDYRVTDTDGSVAISGIGVHYGPDLRQDPDFSQLCIADFDGDGLLDAQELGRPTDPNVVDSDVDDLSDFAEWLLGTDPQDPDSDHDCVADSLDTDPTGGVVQAHCEDGPGGGPRIVIRNFTDPEDADQSFEFFGAVPGSIAHGESLTVSVAPGIHSVTQQEVAGWQLMDIACSDTDSSADVATRTATIHVAEDEVVTCDFFNRTIRGTVLFIHGISKPLSKLLPKNAASASHPCDVYWKDHIAAFEAQGWLPEQLRTVGYYFNNTACDIDLGPRDGAPTVGKKARDASGRPFLDANDYRDSNGATGFSGDTDVHVIAYHWAWYIYNNYTLHREAVSIVAHSMGGLITRYAMVAVEKGEPGWPSVLLIDSVVTLATPHNGGGVLAQGCNWWDQCDDLQSSPTSSEVQRFFLFNSGDRAPQGAGGTDWTVTVGSHDEAVRDSSGWGLDAPHKVRWIEPLCCADDPRDHYGILHPDAVAFPARALDDGADEYDWPGAPGPTELTWKAVASDGL